MSKPDPLKRHFDFLIRKAAVKYESLAHKLGMDPSTLSKKVNGHSPWDSADLSKACEFLKLNESEKQELFSLAGLIKPTIRQEITSLEGGTIVETRTMGQRNTPTEQEEEDEPNYFLPATRYDFVRRAADWERVLQGIRSHSVISIEGNIGIGKSCLAIEIGHHVLASSLFEGVIWIPAGNRPEQKLWLNEVLDRVVRQLIPDKLKRKYIKELPSDKKMLVVDNLLQKYRTLIIIDHFDTVDDPDLVAWIYQISAPSRVLLTARRPNLHDRWVVKLLPFELSDAVALIHNYAGRLSLKDIEGAESEELKPLIRASGGNPWVIKWALVRICNTKQPLKIMVGYIEQCHKEAEDIFNIMVAADWQALRNDDAHQLFMTIAFFADANREELATVTKWHENRLEKALKQLLDFSLLNVEGTLDRQNQRFSIDNIQRSFLQVRLAEHQSWEVQARRRWIKYYLNFVKDSMSRPAIPERYWTYLGGGSVGSIRHEWQNLRTVLEYLDRHKYYKMLVEIMMPLVHYMDRRAYHDIRITYAEKAAFAAQELGWTVHEALFRIDALGVTLRKIERYDDAIAQIQQGLAILESLSLDDKEVRNLKALGFAFSAKVCIEKSVPKEASELEEASQFIKQAMVVQESLQKECIPVIHHRVLVVAGDLAYKKKEYEVARQYYQEAIQVGQSYSMVGDTDLAGTQRKIGFCYLALPDFEQAKIEFMKVINYKGQGGVLNDIYAKFGLAQVLKEQGRNDLAHQRANEAKDVLCELSIGNPLLDEIDDFLNML